MSTGNPREKLMLPIATSPTVVMFSGRDMVEFMSGAQFVTWTVSIIPALMVESTEFNPFSSSVAMKYPERGLLE